MIESDQSFAMGVDKCFEERERMKATVIEEDQRGLVKAVVDLSAIIPRFWLRNDVYFFDFNPEKRELIITRDEPPKRFVADIEFEAEDD